MTSCNAICLRCGAERENLMPGFSTPQRQAIPTFMPGDTKVSYSNVFCDSTTKQAGYLKYVSTTSGGVNRDCKTSANGSEFTFVSLVCRNARALRVCGCLFACMCESKLNHL